MKNSQKGSAGVVFLIIIIMVLLGVIVYSYLKPAQNQQVSQEEENVPAPVTTQTKATAPSYDLMTAILSKLGAVNFNLTASVLEWNTGKTKVNYSGYSFIINHTASENLQIGQTWKNTGTIDKLDISTRFQNELKARGFVQDWNNSGDGTFVGSSGYTKDYVVCVVKDKITTPPEQVSDTSGASSINTIICADKK